MIGFGPLPASVIVVGLALVVAVGAGALTARRRAPGTTRKIAGLITDMTLVGLVAARLAFVIAWGPHYMDNPWSIIYISDGGFTIWAGLLAAVVFAMWRVRRQPALRRPLATAVVSGWVVWVVAGAMLSLAQRPRTAMPDAELARLNGGTVQLAQLSNEPMVVNLWATWCPPCRREMPMLAAAQQHYTGVTFAFVNQRENRAVVREFLRNEPLQLANVLLDTRGAVARSIGSRALPTTLFFDADGRLVDTHMGMLTSATLSATLQQFNLTDDSSPRPVDKPNG